MHKITPFSLPSNEEKKIHFREATTQEAIQLSGVDPDYEEALSTAFLNTIQIPEHHIDAATWTGDDRKFALYWYSINTVEDTQWRPSYSCPHCGFIHEYSLDSRDLALGYVGMQGKPYRDIEVNDEIIRVFPETGHVLEKIERMRIKSQYLEGDERRKNKAEITFMVTALSVDFINEKTDEEDRKSVAETKMRNMEYTTYTDIVKAVVSAKLSMQHGLKTAINDGELELLLPEHACPTSEGGVVTIPRSPFWGHVHIPRL